MHFTKFLDLCCNLCFCFCVLQQHDLYKYYETDHGSFEFAFGSEAGFVEDGYPQDNAMALTLEGNPQDWRVQHLLSTARCMGLFLYVFVILCCSWLGSKSWGPANQIDVCRKWSTEWRILDLIQGEGDEQFLFWGKRFGGKLAWDTWILQPCRNLCFSFLNVKLIQIESLCLHVCMYCMRRACWPSDQTGSGGWTEVILIFSLIVVVVAAFCYERKRDVEETRQESWPIGRVTRRWNTTCGGTRVGILRRFMFAGAIPIPKCFRLSFVICLKAPLPSKMTFYRSFNRAIASGQLTYSKR